MAASLANVLCNSQVGACTRNANASGNKLASNDCGGADAASIASVVELTYPQFECRSAFVIQESNASIAPCATIVSKYDQLAGFGSARLSRYAHASHSGETIVEGHLCADTEVEMSRRGWVSEEAVSAACGSIGAGPAFWAWKRRQSVERTVGERKVFMVHRRIGHMVVDGTRLDGRLGRERYHRLEEKENPPTGIPFLLTVDPCWVVTNETTT